MPNVHLTDAMAKYAQAEVERGAYANLSEVVRAGMRLLMERDGRHAFHALRADLQLGDDDIAAGRVADFDIVAFEPDAFEGDTSHGTAASA